MHGSMREHHYERPLSVRRLGEHAHQFEGPNLYEPAWLPLTDFGHLWSELLPGLRALSARVQSVSNPSRRGKDAPGDGDRIRDLFCS